MLFQRNFQQLEPAQTLLFLSVEGEREQRYFEAIENSFESVNGQRFTIVVDAPQATTGLSSPIHVLQRAIQFRALHPYTDPNRIWLVMDTDEQHKPKLKEILPYASERGFRLAVSNPCFELWLWLHEYDLDPALKDCKSLKRELKFPIDQWQLAPSIERIQAAIARAEALPGSKSIPFPDNPGTQVGELFRYLGLSPIGET